jgi:ubiquinone/menaquinone biosynthesis C-methylase UbiE
VELKRVSRVSKVHGRVGFTRLEVLHQCDRNFTEVLHGCYRARSLIHIRPLSNGRFPYVRHWKVMDGHRILFIRKLREKREQRAESREQRAERKSREQIRNLPMVPMLLEKIWAYFLQVLQSFTECYRVLQSVTECYRVLQSVTDCYTVLQGLKDCYRLLQIVTDCYRVLKSVDRVLKSVTECCVELWIAS